MKVNETLKWVRQDRQMTQKEIARATGTSVPYVCKLETKGFLPSPKFAVRFCRYTGFSYETLLSHIIAERMESLSKILDKKYRISEVTK